MEVKNTFLGKGKGGHSHKGVLGIRPRFYLCEILLGIKQHLLLRQVHRAAFLPEKGAPA
jgi:hypothetical protein